MPEITKTEEPLLDIRDLHLHLPDRAKKPLFGFTPNIEILKGINLRVKKGESVGIVGESGSGKTSFGRTIMRLYEPTGGEIRFKGNEITHLAESELRPMRAEMQMIFQDPMSALNPRHRIYVILTQPLWAFGKVDSRSESERIAGVLLERVGLPPAFVNRYPHELSGGERQRVNIARAVAVRPELLVADEIVSGLDVSAKSRILDLLQGLKDDLGLALIFISHDLAVVNHICDKVLVMHSGEAVETAQSNELFRAPKADYTKRLLSAIPLPVVEHGWLQDSQSFQDTDDPLTKEENEAKMDSQFNTSGCVALVTGANRGIGREFVNALVNRGASKVYACARSTDGVADLVSNHPGTVEAVELDVTDHEQIASVAQQCGDVTLLINNAGINRLSAFVASDDISSARAEMETNYFGTMAMCRAFAAVLGQNGGGAIANILSILARVNLPMMGSLCASKAAELSLTQGVRAETAKQGTLVLAVMPGAVDTDMSRDFPPPKMPPSDVADQTLDALESGQEELYPGDMADGVSKGLDADPKAVEKDFAQYLP